MKKNVTDVEKLATFFSTHKVKCRHCGHPVFLTNSYKFDKMICSVCKHYVYKNELIEFKDRLLMRLRKERKSD